MAMDLEAEAFRGGESGAETAVLRALSVRVSELERQVAALTAQRSAERVETIPAPPPPPLQSSQPALQPSPRGFGETMEAALPPPLVVEPEVARRGGSSLEDRLGSQVFSLVGILAMMVGTSWALKLAFERGLIGPVGRVVIGLGVGAGVVLWSERFRRRELGAFSYTLKAVGTGVLYLSLWAGFQLYHLLPAGVALTAMVLVSAWNAWMAWTQDAELLAGYALIGGFATPLLLATGGDHEAFLFVYLGAIDLATALLLRAQPWRRLMLPAFVVTAGYFIGWYARFFHGNGQKLWDVQASETSAFAVAFGLIFGLVSVRGWALAEGAAPVAGEVIVPVLIPLGNAALVSLALYSVLEDSGMHGGLAWLMVGLAGVYLLLVRVQASALAAAMHLAMAVTFLTVAIPLKASGQALTTAWLVEGVVLYWAATRARGDAGGAGRVLRVLSKAGFGLGLMALAWHFQWSRGEAGFLNASLGSALVAVTALGGAGWLALRAQAGVGDLRTVREALVAINLVAVLLTWHELASVGERYGSRVAFLNSAFGTALVGLAVLGGVAYTCFRVTEEESSLGWIGGGSFVAFNVLAVLSVVREIGSLWAGTGSEVRRSLAISGFLMVYGAMLLAAGFWRRSAFVRWQGLGLLVFTILKVFLYDVSGLSQGYRVVSFLGLGVLLLGVSFAYQRNWLGLKAGEGVR